jgi:hypothetical protein
MFLWIKYFLSDIEIINFDALSIVVCKDDRICYVAGLQKTVERVRGIMYCVSGAFGIRLSLNTLSVILNVVYSLILKNSLLLLSPLSFCSVSFSAILQIVWRLFLSSQHHFNTSPHFLLLFVSSDSLRTTKRLTL